MCCCCECLGAECDRRGAGLSLPRTPARGLRPRSLDGAVAARSSVQPFSDAAGEEQEGCCPLLGHDPFEAIPCTGSQLQVPACSPCGRRGSRQRVHPLWAAVRGTWSCSAVLLWPLESSVGMYPHGKHLALFPQWKDPFETSNFSFPLSKQTVDDEAMAA